ncbi:helix-turn-helix domain-containing protein [Microbacterium lacticum]
MSTIPIRAHEDESLRCFTVPEVAERLAVDTKTVERMIINREIAAFYPRGRGRNRPVRISADELRAVFARTLGE